MNFESINTSDVVVESINKSDVVVPGVIESLMAAAEDVFEALLDVEAAAKLLGGIHPKTLMRKARKREVPAYQISRSWFFRASELDQWLRSLITSNQANNTRVN